MLLKQILLILKARHWLIWVLGLAAFAVSYRYATGLEKQYTATAELLIDVREPDVLTARSNAQSVFTPGYIGTQNDIIRSARVMRRVVETMGLTTSPQAVEQWRKSGSESPLEQYYAELLRGYMEVAPSRGSNVLAIRFRSPSPTFAANAANAVAKVYIETSIELRTEPARNFANWFNERTATERERVEQAQEKLLAFQREHGIISLDERSDVEYARLTELGAKLTATQIARTDSSTRVQEARGNQGTSPDVVNNAAVASLRGEILRMEASLERIAQQYGPRHPNVLRAQTELDALRARLQESTERVVGTVGAANDINQKLAGQFAAELAAQKAKVLRQRELRDELFTLQREVDVAQRQYDLVASRLAQSNLDSQVDQTNIVLLTEARAPLLPSGPNVLPIILAWTALGTLTGAVLAVLVEFVRPRFRTVEEAAGVLQLPVLTTLSGARPRRFERLRVALAKLGRPRWPRLRWRLAGAAPRAPAA